MMSQCLSFGIDLGTTTVKISVIDASHYQSADQRSPIYAASRAHNANIAAVSPPRNEQCVAAICKTFTDLVLEMGTALGLCEMRKISKICVTGQMHGCVLWNSKQQLSLQEVAELSTVPLGERNGNARWSNLITWQDGRCDDAFLKALPPSKGALHSGFGWANIYWLQRHGQINSHWDRCGTIQDLLVAMLCGSSTVQMTAQNAYSWGFFDLTAGCWETVIHSDFDEKFIPEIIQTGSVVGNTREDLLGIPTGARVFAALGDFPTTVFAQLEDNCAILNIGTSAQFCFATSNRQAIEIADRLCTVSPFPYFADEMLVTAASLNGGNVLDAFVETLTSWSQQVTGVETSKSEAWERVKAVLSSDFTHAETNAVFISPLIFGERHSPNTFGCVRNISHMNGIDLKQVLNQLCLGVVRNLATMLPSDMLKEFGVQRIVLTGQANEAWFKRAAEFVFAHLFQVEQSTAAECSAAFGAAFFAASRNVPV